MRTGRFDLVGRWRATLSACVIAAGVAGCVSSGALAGGARSSARAARHGSSVPRVRRLAGHGIEAAPSRTKPHWACPEEACEAIVMPRPLRSAGARRFVLPGAAAALEGSGELGGLSPADLASAYDIPTSGAAGRTVAVVDSFSYKNAERDLAAFRSRYGLPACTKRNHCFTHVNQSGGHPKASRKLIDKGWEMEAALDLDMASAGCPECKLMLVNAEDGTWLQLGESVDTAVRLGASAVANSYGIPEEDCGEECEETLADFGSHPGVLVTAAAGDKGFVGGQSGPDFEWANYPATLPGVVAVGGTSLKRAENARGWSEKTWWEPAKSVGTDSGCAMNYAGLKPPWQLDDGCTWRTDNDVAAVAACETPVSVYDSSEGGWNTDCGTSASAALVAGIEAHSSAYSLSLPGADAFYKEPSAFNDITSGKNGECAADVEYLCTAGPGWDGPTGNGTPHGALELTGAAPDVHTSPPSAIGGGSATLNGEVQPNGKPTSYRFEYGTSLAYGSSIPVPAGEVGAGKESVAVSQTLAGMEPEAVYHYRLVASSSEGTTYGQDETVTEAPPAVTSISPDEDVSAGGAAVTISGAHFLHVTEVRFGGARASFTVDSEGQITATDPGNFGTVDVTVTTLAGTSATGPGDEMTYHLGPVLGWGAASEISLRDKEHNAYSPEEVTGLPEAVKQLAAGEGFSLALLASGRVDAFGYQVSNELGNPAGGTTPTSVCAPEVPSCAEGPYLQGVRTIAAGGQQSAAVLEDGTVVQWGKGTLNAPTPIHVCLVEERPCAPANYLRGARALALGREFGLALLENGTVWAWGADGVGQLGDGGTSEELVRHAVQVKGVAGAKAIAAAGWTGYAVLEDGTVKAWGAGEFGDLGNGRHESSDVPVQVCAAVVRGSCSGPLSGVRSMSASGQDGYALMEDGTVRDWGWNRWRQLGQGEGEGPEMCPITGIKANKTWCSTLPIAVPGLSGVEKLVSGLGSAGSGEVTIAVTEAGALLVWGEGGGGIMGNGFPPEFAFTPTHICAPYTQDFTSCAEGPWLEGHVTALAIGADQVIANFEPAL